MFQLIHLRSPKGGALTRGLQIKSAGRGAELRGAAPPLPSTRDLGAWVWAMQNGVAGGGPSEILWDHGDCRSPNVLCNSSCFYEIWTGPVQRVSITLQVAIETVFPQVCLKSYTQLHILIYIFIIIHIYICISCIYICISCIYIYICISCIYIYMYVYV